jgi:hypothetical protein
MSQSDQSSIDYEQWRELARQDPNAFEVRRLELIESVIGAAPQHCQRRLRGLQWRIDMIRARSPNPLAACVSLSHMMWDSFAGEAGLVQALNGRYPSMTGAPPKVKLLPFTAPASNSPCRGRDFLV